MAFPKRAASFSLIVVAMALTVGGVVLAATDPHPGAAAKDPLALNGYPPKSAQLRVVISTGSAFHVTGDVNINFVTNELEAQLQIPLFVSSTSIDVRLVNQSLYIGSPNLASVVGAPWLTTSLKSPSLYGLALEMTKPDVSLISALGHETVTHSGDSTTYDFHRGNVVLAVPSKTPVAMPPNYTVDFALTTGQRGEATAATLSLTSKTSTTSLAVTVLSYNQPVSVAVPPANEVKHLTSAQLQKLFGSLPLGGLFALKNLNFSGLMHLN